MLQLMSIHVTECVVDDIPLDVYVEGPTESKRLVIWLPGFSGHKGNCERELTLAAEMGFVGVAFEPYQHGKRQYTETNDQLRARIAGNIRRYFWPILAQTAEETPLVIDWAIETLGVSPDVCMGGVSMGGDTSVAAAGIDHRIVAVAALIATPDWMRPGSHEPPGVPDSFALNAYARVNPLTNLDRYRHCPAITFECGADDTQVPPDGADRFAEALRGAYSSCPDRLRVVKHAGVGHRATEEMAANALAWFRRW